VWCQLAIFGGRRGIFGNLPLLATSIIQDLQNTTMIGIGATPEAIEMIPITFDLLWDMSWRQSSPDVSAWVNNYSQRRYGAVSPSLQQAWQTLLPAAFSLTYNYGTTKSFCWLEDSPGLFRTDHDGTNPNGILQALRLFMAAANNSEVCYISCVCGVCVARRSGMMCI
jgi:hypothetical protein